MLLRSAPTPLAKRFKPAPTPNEAGEGGRCRYREAIPTRTRGTLFPTPHPPLQYCAYPVVGAPVIQTHPNAAGEQGRAPRGHLLSFRATPGPLPQLPVPPASALPCSGGRSGVGRGESPRGGPTSARTWFGRGDPSGAAPSPAGARESLEPRPLRCRGVGWGAPRPRPALQPGLGAPRGGARRSLPSAPARAAGAGEGGAGVVSPPKGVRGPPRTSPARRSAPLRTCPGRSGTGGDSGAACGVCCGNPGRRRAPGAASARRPAPGCVARRPPSRSKPWDQKVL